MRPPGRGSRSSGANSTRRARGPGEFDRVTFAPWRIRAVWLGGILRRALGTPHWARLDRTRVVALLGPRGAGTGEW